MMWTDERLARAALTAAVEPGSVTTANRLCEMTAEGLWRQLPTDSGERWHERAKSLDVGRLVERSEQAAMRFLIPGDQEWPTSLDSLARVAKSGMGGIPLGLWVVGPAHLANMSQQSVAIVGCRSPSSYGQDVAVEMAYQLVRGHCDGTGSHTVVSGGAFGIDVAAHWGGVVSSRKHYWRPRVWTRHSLPSRQHRGVGAHRGNRHPHLRAASGPPSDATWIPSPKPAHRSTHDRNRRCGSWMAVGSDQYRVLGQRIRKSCHGSPRASDFKPIDRNEQADP